MAEVYEIDVHGAALTLRVMRQQHAGADELERARAEPQRYAVKLLLHVLVLQRREVGGES